MSHRLRGFWISFIIHAALVLLLLGVNSSMERFSKPVIIDFSVEDSSEKGDPGKASTPNGREGKPGPAEQITPQPALTKQEPMPQQSRQPTNQQPGPQQAAAISEAAAEGQAPAAASGSAPAGIQSAAAGSGSSAAAHSAKEGGKGTSSHGEGASGEAMKQSYLREHFAYIRKLVQQKLSYPKVARKMGWEGKVIISFIVCTDGRAKDITIREGSGFELLDKNAITAVRDATPFPRPPVEAQLIIPIDYRLN